MDLDQLKNQFIKDELGITSEDGKIYTFIDFGNVNYWFEKDRQNFDNTALKENEKLTISFIKLKDFIDIFSSQARLYYGHDSQKKSSLGFITSAKDVFGKKRVFTKPIQKIRHRLTEDEQSINTRTICNDNSGDYVNIPKCNFDVEITVDAIRLLNEYDTFCLFSSDADFVSLIRYLKSKGKRIIIVKGGEIVHQLREIADNRIINAQNIKKHITEIKQKPDVKSGLADRKPVSTGR